MEELLHLKGIVKKFPGVVANDNVDFTLRKGEIHALLGENGAGKTTLMNIVYGLYKPDAGEIYVEGKRVEIRSPRDAIKLGIGMVHQNFKLIPSHTVMENIILGLKDVGFVINRKKVGEEIRKLSEQYGWRIDPYVYVWQLSAGEKQQVELLKILYRKAKILILDEPTSVLTPQECRNLFHALRKMAEEGIGIIFITHKLEEALSISDRITVMRKGKIVATKNAWETSIEELTNYMIGRPVLFKLDKNKTDSSEDFILIRNLKAYGDTGALALKNVNLTIRKNEILGIIGVTGNGQQELAEVLAGLRKAIDGQVLIDGMNILNYSPLKLIELGVAYIPPEPIKYGIAPNLTIRDNLFLKAYRYKPYSSRIFINLREVEKKAEEIIRRFNVVCPNTSIKARSLSGGNIQRLILARELSELINGWKPRFIIAAYPTKGLDISAAEFVNRTLIDYSKTGSSILYITEDIEEAMMVCDRIAVMYDGRIMGVFKPGEVSIEKIGLMMAGAETLTTS
ncbi:MAG: ABC transporter ATP-binding protein [Nitrososphaerota archaeon]|nr:ABC transporter ATP-binding protein [Candidatus Geocrenenecus dongiae]